MKNLTIGEKVKHEMFGIGIIKNIDEDFVTVIFEKYGERKILNTFLKPYKENENDATQQTVTKRQIFKRLIKRISSNNTKYMSFNLCCKYINTSFNHDFSKQYLRNLLNPFHEIIYLRNLNETFKSIPDEELDKEIPLGRTKFHSNEEAESALNFKYFKELAKFKNCLTEDLYLLDEIKEIMTDCGLPYYPMSLNAFLSASGYKLQTKNVVLNKNYPTLTAYYKDIISQEDLYYYSNPKNLNEYDAIIKYLLNQLFIIEIRSGVYLTEKSMKKYGVYRTTIDEFHEKVKSYGINHLFFSIKKICAHLERDAVVRYCDGDINQILQFIKTTENLKYFKLGNGYIFSFDDSKNKRGRFLEYILRKKNSMDIYDIQSFVLETYGVEYSIEQIEKDVSETSLYYSEEMEKIYKDKDYFLWEVFDK